MTDRRAFLRGAATAAVASAGLVGSAEQSEVPRRARVSKLSTGARPKNVILMICDDLGYGDLGCYGSQIPTPNLDALAAEGMRFNRCDSAHPICSASRAALLTGRYAARSHTLGAYFPNSPTGMDLDETTLANLFRAGGFRTKAIGKWHLGDAPPYLPTHRGFDSFFGVPYSDDMQPLPLMRDDQKLDQDTDRDVLTQRYTTEALSFLKEKPSQPAFLYLAFSYPHDPARASSAFRGKTALGDYGDSVHEIDWSVGEIIKHLRQSSSLEDTLVIFTSDHGPWYQGSPGGLRGRKGTNFEGGHRVPLIAHWPKGVSSGHVSDTWASSLDVLPTLVSTCGLKSPAKPLDGLDLTHVLRAEETELKRNAVVYFAPIAAGGLEIHCARSGDWKLRMAQITGEIYVSDAGSGREGYWLQHPELYNLAKDPAESFDIAKFNPEIVAAILNDVQALIPSFPPEVAAANKKLKENIARITTPPGAAPRANTHQPLPSWAWEPPDRRDQS